MAMLVSAVIAILIILLLIIIKISIVLNIIRSTKVFVYDIQHFVRNRRS